MIKMKTKCCGKCKHKKLINNFYKDISHNDGYQTICKFCRADYNAIYRKKNKVKIRKRKKEYYNKNKYKLRIEMKKQYRIHKDKRLKQAKKYYKEHRTIILRTVHKYALKNREKINNGKLKYILKRKRTDIKFNILFNLRSRLHHALKDNCKSSKTIKLLGCTVEFLKAYLQAKFKQGMSWKNYGKWHIDHIRPCASFDLSKPSEQRKCFHYTNLQPLWAKDNRKKSDRYDK